jgi:hypothetical protein
MNKEELRMTRAVRQLTLTETSRILSKKLGRNVPITTIAHWEAGSMVIPDDVTPECFEA